MPVNLHIGTWLAPIIIAASSLGIGTGVLTCIRYRTCSRFETLGVAFALGSGIIGWSTFWVGVAGYLTPVPLALLLLPGLVLLTRTLSVWRIGVEVPAGFQRLLVGLLLVSLGIDFLEALSPAADIDTTAYHFALPRRFLKAGAVEFVPVAVEGAVPLLTHMNYTLAFGLGGERGLQLWILITELVLIISFYAYARRFLSLSWALALSVVLLTTPAVIYGGGTGHVETRTALFMLVGAFAAADGNRVGNPGAAIVAGLAAGFF